MRIDGKDGLMKKIYTGKSLDELKALAISEIKELGVDEADIKITPSSSRSCSARRATIR